MDRWGTAIPISFWFLMTLLNSVTASGMWYAADLLSWLEKRVGRSHFRYVVIFWSFFYHSDPILTLGNKCNYPHITLLRLPSQNIMEWVASTTDICFLTFLKARSLRPRCQQVCRAPSPRLLDGYLYPVASRDFSCVCPCLCPDHLFFFLTFFKCLFIFERERHRVELGRGRERGRHWMWSRLQVLSCQHRAQGSNPWTQDHDLSRKTDAQLTEPPRHPSPLIIRTQVILN